MSTAARRAASAAAETSSRGSSRRGLLRAVVVAGAASALTVYLAAHGPAAQADGRRSPPAHRRPEVERFHLQGPQNAIDDLRRRLLTARLPEQETVGDVSQGVPLKRLRVLNEYWRITYDRRDLESRLNEAGRYRTRIDGLGVHFLHIPSQHPHALLGVPPRVSRSALGSPLRRRGCVRNHWRKTPAPRPGAGASPRQMTAPDRGAECRQSCCAASSAGARSTAMRLAWATASLTRGLNRAAREPRWWGLMISRSALNRSAAAETASAT